MSAAAIAIEQSSRSPNSDLLDDDNEEVMQAAAAVTTTGVTAVVAAAAAPPKLNTTPVSSTAINSGIGGAGDDSPPSASSVPPPSLDQHCRFLEEENQSLKDLQAQLQQQVSDAQRRERILMRRLANKEQEFQDYVSQIAEYKSAQAPGSVALRSALLDPAVNLLFEKLKHELQTTRAKLEETQNELSAWKFTPDSNTGKRLMAKCRLLYQENEELGKMTSNGRLAKLEGELAMQKSFSEEVKKSQSELDDFIQELDEDVEGMQSTILFLQEELKATRERIQVLEKENYSLKNGLIDDSNKVILMNGKSTLQTVKECEEISGHYNCEERTLKISSNSCIILNSSAINNNVLNDSNNVLRTNNSNIIYNGTELTNINGVENATKIDVTTKETLECTTSDSNKSKIKKRNYDSDSSENSSTNGCTLRSNKKLRKKTRRSSVLSIDLNEDDTQMVDESEEESNQRITTRRKSARNQQIADN